MHTIEHSFQTEAFTITTVIQDKQKLNLYGKHSRLSCHLHVSVLRHINKALGCFVCVNELNNCIEMFQIIAIYDDERVLDVSESQSWSILCHGFSFNALYHCFRNEAWYSQSH